MKRKGIRYCIFYLMVVAVILSAAGGWAADLKVLPLNPEFLKWREEQKALRKNAGERLHRAGRIPVPMDLSHLAGARYEVKADDLPAAFDLRNVDGKNFVTPVRNQGQTGTCWTFAAMGSLESTQLMAGQAERDLSEMHLAWFAFKDDVAFTIIPRDDNPLPVHDPEAVLSQGGHWGLVSAVLGRWTGPTAETNCPMSLDGRAPDDKNVAIPSKPASAYPRVLTLRECMMAAMPNPETANHASVLRVAKQWIRERGALTIGYHAPGGKMYEAYYNEKTCAQYIPEKVNANHDVTLIGWDDNFSKENFTTQPPSDGAWLIKNSWGTDVPGLDEGYFWLSYYDVTVDEVVQYLVTSDNAGDNIYLHDPLGAVRDISGGLLWTPRVANAFQARGSEEITAVTFNTIDANLRCTVEIYTDIPADNPTGGTRRVSISGTQPFAGYHTVQLDTPVYLRPGSRFAVVLFFENNEDEGEEGLKIPVECRLEGVSDQADSAPGESFYRDDGAWKDLNAPEKNFEANFCIRALTRNVTAPRDSSGGGCNAGLGLSAIALLFITTRKQR